MGKEVTLGASWKCSKLDRPAEDITDLQWKSPCGWVSKTHRERLEKRHFCHRDGWSMRWGWETAWFCLKSAGVSWGRSWRREEGHGYSGFRPPVWVHGMDLEGRSDSPTCASSLGIWSKSSVEGLLQPPAPFSVCHPSGEDRRGGIGNGVPSRERKRGHGYLGRIELSSLGKT